MQPAQHAAVLPNAPAPSLFTVKALSLANFPKMFWEAETLTPPSSQDTGL